MTFGVPLPAGAAAVARAARMRRVSISLVSVPEDEGHKLNLRAIEGMAVALMLDQPLPPIELLPRADGHFDLCDGRHRFVAHLLAGRAHIDAELVDRAGT